MMRAAAVLGFVLLATSAGANCRATQIGAHLFTQCTDGGYSVETRIGHMTFGHGVDATGQPHNWTVERIGRETFYTEH